MKWKWLAGCLACLLLLCGCRTAEPTTSVDNSVKTTVQITTVATTTEQTLTPVTQLPLSTTKATTVHTTKKELACSGYPSVKNRRFYTMSSYRDTLKSIDAAAKLWAAFEDEQGRAPGLFEEYMEMLLQDKFFVIPDLSAGELEVPFSFSADGITRLFLRLPNDTLKPDTVSLVIHHHKTTTIGRHVLDKEDFAPITYTTKAGLQVTQKGEHTWVLDIDGYPVLVTSGDAFVGKMFVDTLTFEKVEIM